ncbi:MAG: phospholipase D family protein [Flavobacterium circumlabens]|uniref:phospholipase D family protein n=1 Tax=Flavobacterium circumlabens TaxID=2133765 RepID=UPI00326750E9
MKTITQNLQSELKSKLKTADEVWIAVALMTKKGLEFIQENLPDNTKQNYVLGVDLPTDPLALEILCKQQLLQDVSVKMFYNQEFYHPKVYIIKSKEIFTAFVGSANCTKSGLFSNIELSFTITNQSDCTELLDWYKSVDSKSASLTDKFIQDYRLIYKTRLIKKEEDEVLAKKSKEKLKEEYEVTMLSRKELISALKKYRKSIEYSITKRKRNQDIVEIKESIDYPFFNNINVDEFFNLWELGHLIAIPKPTIKTEISRFKSLLLVLIDDNIDISVRINRALKGDLKIRGVGEALISKILTTHDPQKYFVKNNKIDSVLERYGIELPKRISIGEKYKATNKFLIEICEETGIDDLAILDYYLYIEANE